MNPHHGCASSRPKTAITAQVFAGCAWTGRRILILILILILIRHCKRFVSEVLLTHGHLLTSEQVRAAAEKAQLSKMGATSWPAMLGSDSLQPAHLNTSWQIIELCSLAALREEGLAMNHCVAGYTRRCKQGSSAIFSLRHIETDAEGNARSVSYATIEVHPRSRKIVQLCAFRNRLVNNSVHRLIQTWAQRNRLY
jgi:hypothetical protein